MNSLRKELRFTRNVTILSTLSLIIALGVSVLAERFQSSWPQAVLVALTALGMILLLLGLLLALGEVDFRGARGAVLKPFGIYNATLKWGTFVVFRSSLSPLVDPPRWVSILIGATFVLLTVTLSGLIVKRIHTLKDTGLQDAFVQYYQPNHASRVSKALSDNKRLAGMYLYIGLLTVIRFEASFGGDTIPLMWAIWPVYGLLAFFVIRKMSLWVSLGVYEGEPSLGSLQKGVFLIGLLIMVVLHLETTLMDDLWNRFFFSLFIFTVPVWRYYLNLEIIEMTRYAPLAQELGLHDHD